MYSSLLCSFKQDLTYCHHNQLWQYILLHCNASNLVLEILKHVYANLLRKVWAALKEKRRGKMCCRVLFLQNNAPACTSSEELAAIQNAGFKLLDHQPYLSDLAPNDYYLFPKLNEFMKGCKFDDNNNIISTANGFSTMKSDLWRNAGPSYVEKWQNMMCISSY